MNNDRGNSDGKFIFGLFLGGLLGALTVFFVGTPEGKKAGKAIGKKGKELLGDLEDRVDDLQERGRQLLEQGEVLKEELREKLEEKKEELSAEAVEKIDRALENFESIQHKGIETTENLRKQFKNIPKKPQAS